MAIWVSLIVFITVKAKRNSSLLQITTVPRYSYRDLQTAAHGLDERTKLGEGRSSIVYRGTLEDGSLVVIKKLKKGFKEGSAFATEIGLISRISHHNLLSLQGWCYEGGKALLVYNYMPKCLDNYLFGSRKGALNSEARFRILQGVGSALEYLHENCILHRDVKAANVRLTEGFEPMLGDFGVARLIAHKRTGRLPAYIAPEVVHTGRATHKADVYSFGILALELACGRPASADRQSSLIDWVWMLQQRDRLMDALDPSMHALNNHTSSSSSSSGITLCVDEELQWRCVLHVALMCCHPLLEARPTMQEAAQVLHETKILPLPASKPTCPPPTPNSGCSALAPV